jgi:hypothetical protein
MPSLRTLTIALLALLALPALAADIPGRPAAGDAMVDSIDLADWS